MDVGLNNRNTLGEIEPAFKDVVFMVEANSNETQKLWEEWAKESMTNIEAFDDDVMNIFKKELGADSLLFGQLADLNHKVKNNQQPRVNWEQIRSGFAIRIGEINGLPVNVEFSFAIIEGKKICFYNAISQMVNYKMVEDWLIERFQLTNDGYCRWNRVDAQNFHNCINSLDRLDKEPRDTVYKIKG